MFKNSVVIGLTSLAAVASAAFAADMALPYNLRTTKADTFVISIDNSLPGDQWGVVFAVKGDSTSRINNKRWDIFAQKQLIDCADLTYVVVEGLYMWNGKAVEQFNNVQAGKARWRSANNSNDVSLRVVEFCANTKIYGD